MNLGRVENLGRVGNLEIFLKLLKLLRLLRLPKLLKFLLLLSALSKKAESGIEPLSAFNINPLTSKSHMV